MPNNKITFGLRNVHYAIANQDNNGNWSFDTPVALQGAQEFSSEVVGGSTNVSADDTLYASLVQNAGRTLTLKFTEIPDEFKTAVLGYKRLANGNLVEIANAPVVTFALGFEFQGDAKARRVWYYLCSVTLNITARPIEVGDDLITNCVSAKGDSNYTNFLTTAPVIPEIPASNP